jgi:hypothetical protein
MARFHCSSSALVSLFNGYEPSICRPHSTTNPPNNSAKPLAVEAGSISGTAVIVAFQEPGAAPLSITLKQGFGRGGGAAHAGVLNPEENVSPALLLAVNAANDVVLVPNKIPPVTLRLHAVSMPVASVEKINDVDSPGPPATGLFEFR